MLEVFNLVQGDIFELYLTVKEDEMLDVIDKITFSCYDQKVVQDFSYVSGKEFMMAIPSEKTKSFNPKICSFDITIKFVDGEILTGIFENKLQVLRKRNRLD